MFKNKEIAHLKDKVASLEKRVAALEDSQTLPYEPSYFVPPMSVYAPLNILVKLILNRLGLKVKYEPAVPEKYTLHEDQEFPGISDFIYPGAKRFPNTKKK